MVHLSVNISCNSLHRGKIVLHNYLLFLYFSILYHSPLFITTNFVPKKKQYPRTCAEKSQCLSLCLIRNFNGAFSLRHFCAYKCCIYLFHRSFFSVYVYFKPFIIRNTSNQISCFFIIHTANQLIAFCFFQF